MSDLVIDIIKIKMIFSTAKSLTKVICTKASFLQSRPVYIIFMIIKW
jgi:hypothetical protein